MYLNIKVKKYQAVFINQASLSSSFSQTNQSKIPSNI